MHILQGNEKAFKTLLIFLINAIHAIAASDRGEAGRYVTEGMFRASHRAEADPSKGPRAAATLPGAPFHSFEAHSAQPLVPGEAARLRFQMLPTAYRFAKVSNQSYSNDANLLVLAY